MPNLLSASKITANASMQARIAAAIRHTAPAKTNGGGASAALAARVMAAPDAAASVAAHFLARISTNGDAVAEACPDCGYSMVSDETVLWIVDDQWDEVAAITDPQPAG